MSRTHELRVGVRVKVVAPDPTDVDRRPADAYRYVGATGTIVRRWGVNRFGYDWGVDIDGDRDNPWPFTPQELAPLDESNAAPPTVIEGVISERSGEWFVGDTNFSYLPWSLDSFDIGTRVRVTIEVLADSADSQSQVSAVGDAVGDAEGDEGDEGGDGR